MNGFRNSEENQQTTDKRVRHYTSKTYPLLNNAVFSLEAATIFKNFCFSCSLIANNLTSDIVKSVRQTRSAKKGEGDDTRSVVPSFEDSELFHTTSYSYWKVFSNWCIRRTEINFPQLRLSWSCPLSALCSHSWQRVRRNGILKTSNPMGLTDETMLIKIENRPYIMRSSSEDHPEIQSLLAGLVFIICDICCSRASLVPSLVRLTNSLLRHFSQYKLGIQVDSTSKLRFLKFLRGSSSPQRDSVVAVTLLSSEHVVNMEVASCARVLG